MVIINDICVCLLIIIILGTLFPVQRHFLEDTIEIIKWNPRRLSYLDDDVEASEAMGSTGGGGPLLPVSSYSQFGSYQADEDAEFDTLMNYDNDPAKTYSPQTWELVNKLREGVICFELIVSILEYIERMYISGAVLIFLPGWTAIFELLHHLKDHPVFGNESRFTLLPLHSQLSHKDNHRVFSKVFVEVIIIY